MQYTQQQSAAIKSRSEEILISASAGSGKTMVLTQRIADIIQNREASVSEMLIVTFTNQAAAEMKDRISRAISHILDEARENSSPLISFYEEELMLTEYANICTLHSFCRKILTKYYSYVGLSHRFHVLDDVDVNLIKQRAIDNVMQRLYKKAAESNFTDRFSMLLNEYSSFKSDEDVRNAIIRLADLALDNSSPEAWFDKSISNVLHPVKYPEYVMKTFHTVIEMVSELRESIYSMLLQIEPLLKDSPNIIIDYCDDMAAKRNNSKSKKYNVSNNLLEALHYLLVYFDSLLMHKGNIDEFISAVGNCSENVTAPNVKGIRYSNPQQTQARTLQDFCTKFVNETLIPTFKGYNGDTGEESQSNPVLALIEAARDYLNEFNRLKKAKNSIDFNDMEHLTIELIKNNESIHNEITSKFKHIFFDEYQDCSPIQNELISLIKKNTCLFMVGDIKQCIYRFRRADPEIILHKYNTFSTDPGSDRYRIDLNTNFRSNINVLNTANTICAVAMKKELCGFDYNRDNALVCGNTVEEYPLDRQNIYFPPTELLVTTGGKSITDLSQYNLVAQTIQDIVDTQMYFPKEKRVRKIKYSDIAVLSQSLKSKVDRLSSVFSSANIPYIIGREGDISKSVEYNILRGLILSIDNPYDNVSLFALLSSYIFDFTPQMLAHIRSITAPTPRDIYTSLLIYVGQTPPEAPEFHFTAEPIPEYVERVNAFLEKFNSWREKERYMQAGDFISWLITDEVRLVDYITMCCEKSGISLSLDRIQAIRTSIKGSLEKTDGGLFECANTIRDILDNEIKFAQRSSGQDTVLISTVHQSKGREYPIVFLIDTQDAYHREDKRTSFIPHAKYGVVSKIIKGRKLYPSLHYNCMLFQERLEQTAEKLRLLYVALTRAQAKLYICAGLSALERKKRKLPVLLASRFLKNSFFSVILDVICPPGEVISDRLSAISGERLFGIEYPSLWKTTNYEEPIDLDDSIDLFSISIECNADDNDGDTNGKPEKITLPKDIDALLLRIKDKYRYSDAIGIPSKLAATSASEAYTQNIGEDYVPQIFAVADKYSVQSIYRSRDNKATGAQIGSLYHFFMQHATISQSYDKALFDSDMQRLLDARLITCEEAAYIKPQKIISFFSSEIGQRLCKSKKIYREKAFSCLFPACKVIPSSSSNEDILVQGIIDCMFIDDDGKAVLIDYKTDVINDADTLLDRYRGQISLYTDAIHKISDITVKESYIYSFNIAKYIKV
ncbi:MAG: hypothetical protein E7315_01660 [Clostridiales bacterium]|nr:hypothetical protein [Clostridiales bacterium]